MSQKISANIPKIFQIFQSFKNKLYSNYITDNDIKQIIEALKFVDNLNLFMEESDVKKFKERMGEITSILQKRNYDFKDEILHTIQYTEMTIINHRNNIYRKMYFNNHKGLSEEIENELDQVNKGNKFDFRLFKQMQNIYWVVKNVIDDKKKAELDNRLENMKIMSKKIKEKRNNYSRRGYQNYDDYGTDYIDYKNYMGTYDYNDNYIRNDDSGYYKSRYDDMGNKSHYYRGGYRKNNYNNNINNSNRKYYSKKQPEEKEVEIPSDPSYYNNKYKEEDLKEENNEGTYNDSSNNNLNLNENNNINGGNDLNNIENNNDNVNSNDFNEGVKEEPNPVILDQKIINNENNSGNGDNSNVNNINNNELNKNNDIEIITGNTNLTQNNPGNYKRKSKNYYQNKMIAVEIPSSSGQKENNNISNENENNINANIKDNTDDNNNNEAKIENNNSNNNINNSMDNNNNYTNVNNNEHSGDDNFNPEIKQYNPNNNFNKYKNSYGYKSNIYNKNNYHNHYNRYNNQNNININNPNKKYYLNKKRDFVEIDENNKIISNTTENNNVVDNQNENADLVNDQENENVNNINKDNIDEINNITPPNESNSEMLNDPPKNNNLDNINNNNNQEINPSENTKDENELNSVKSKENLQINTEENENDKDKIDPNKNIELNNNNNNNININDIKEDDNNKNLINTPNNIDKINIVPNNIDKTNSMSQNEIDNYIDPNQNPEEDQKEEIKENINSNLNHIENINNINNDDYNNNRQEIEEENLDNHESNDHMNEEEEDEEDLKKYKGDFNIFLIEAGMEPKDDYAIKIHSSDDKEEDEKIENNNLDEKDLDEAIQDDIENGDLMEMEPEERLIELKIRELMKILNIPQIINDALDELEKEELEKEKINNKENKNNNENTNDNNHNHSNKYIDTLKDIDQKLRDRIKAKISTSFKNEEMLKFSYYTNNFFKQNPQMFSKTLLSYIQEYKKNPPSSTPLFNYIISRYNLMQPNKENLIFQEYLYFKTLEIESPQYIWNNMQSFEKRILIPLYQKIINIRFKRYHTLESIYQQYVSGISKIFQNSNDVIEKIQKYGSFHNTFMVEIGDTDIDICIVPKCSLSDFESYHLEKLKKGITKSNLGVVNNVIINNSLILLKVTYSSPNQKLNINVDISVHNMLPIFNSYLIRLYGLFDQRFHIMGIYLKYWAKNNKIHGAQEGYLSSYALLIMIIHFLQKVVEPKVLPNLQKIPINDDYENPIYGEEKYEYYYNGKKIIINSYFEKDAERIKENILKINNGKVNEETVTNLLVKFFEYYAYIYESKEKISVHKDLINSIKDKEDKIAFSIDDPFEITNNPGKTMIIGSEMHKKFIKAMKKEVNFILSGEYVKRLDIEKKIKLSGNNIKNMS